ncbi:MAG: hypothetical protein ACRYG4_23570 [Janthinobacterium lividum]
MSRRLDVLKALKAMVQTALPGATVKGLDADAAKPDRIPAAGGLVIIRSGDPGPATSDLSPRAYNYEHAIPLEISAYQSSSRTTSEVVDDMLTQIGAAIAADRTLGGLCFWLDAEAPAIDDVTADGAPAGAGADLVITATYVTSNPLE